MPTIFFSVGEPSGDLHGANLIRAIQSTREDVRCVGYGGPKMEAAGLELHADLTRFAVMWIFRVLVNLRHFFRLLWRADSYFSSHRPDAVVLIDYPGFNWWIARRAKARGIPVIYYGAPQLWAWAPWRVAKMKRLIDHVLCKLPFEENWFRQRGCNATFVGHPYFDELADRKLDLDFIRQLGIDSPRLVTILPGSRSQEVIANLPSFLRAAQEIQKQSPDVAFAVASFDEKQALAAREIQDGFRDNVADVSIHAGRTAELIEAADVCLACSGSVSLELLYHGKPSIILYQVTRLAWWLQDRFRISRYITLVNLLATERIERLPADSNDPDAAGHAAKMPMPEYVTWQDRSHAIATRVVRLLNKPEEYTAVEKQLEGLRKKYARPGASQKAATYILSLLETPSPAVKRPHFLSVSNHRRNRRAAG